MSFVGRRNGALVALIVAAIVVMAFHVRFHATYQREFKIVQVPLPESVSLSVLYRRHPILIYKGADDPDRLKRVFDMQYVFTQRVVLSPGGKWMNRSKFAALTYRPDDVTDDAPVTVRMTHPRPGVPSVDVRLSPRSQALVLPMWWTVSLPSDEKALKDIAIESYDDIITRAVTYAGPVFSIIKQCLA